MTITERLIDKIELDRVGCWNFTGYRTKSGYGQIGRGGRSEGTTYAHRASYEAFVGPIPEGLDLDHLCRNRGCINPSHLEPVTRRVNLLRGMGPTATNSAKTHCKRGHEFTTENTRHNGKGRQCITCDHIRRTA